MKSQPYGVQDYVLDDQHNIWFVRFSLDYNCRFVACGGGTGRINVFDCDVLTKEPKFVIKPVAGSESTVCMPPFDTVCGLCCSR